MDAGEIRDLYENMRALLETGQPPVLRVLLRVRFLEIALPESPAVWSAYGYETASALASDLVAAGPGGLSPRDRIATLGVFDRCAALPVPPHGDRVSWEKEIDGARRFLAGPEAGDRDRRGWDRLEERPSRLPGDVIVPGVARLRGNDSAHPRLRDLTAGGLIPVTVRAEGVLRANPSGRRMSGPVRRGPGEESLRRVPEEAARLRVWGAPSPSRTRFELEMDRTPASLDGRSCELALVLGAAAAWSVLAPRFRYRRIREGVAMTGVVSNGEVRPVEGTTLAAKVEACFHGPVRFLCVPISEEEHASSIARNLRAEHPERGLGIRGVGAIRDVWEDRDICEDVRRSFFGWLVTLFRRIAVSRTLTGILLLIAVLLASLVGREWYLNRPLPAAAHWEGDRVFVANRHGRVIFVIDEPGRYRPHNVENATFDKIGARLAVWDLDGDGVSEILVMFRGNGALIERMSAYDCHGRRLWSHDAPGFGFPPGITEDSFQWIAFYSAGTRERGSLQLMAVRRSALGSLSIADRIDGATGEHRGMLANDGHMEGVYPLDADGDGSLELLMSATHNPSGMGLLAVIRLDGWRPSAEPLPPGRIPHLTDPSVLNAGVVAAIRFPLDDHSVTRAHAREIGKRGGFVHVCVIGGWGERSLPTERAEFRCVLYYLDCSVLRRPVLERVAFVDSYRALIMGYHPEFTNDDLDAEAERLARGTEYLTSEGWRPVPRRE
ncbi:MAG: hypothetical protein ABIK65_07840 [Candidatus Eisenbacteria bacterium]